MQLNRFRAELGWSDVAIKIEPSPKVNSES